jgi:hypothetical protein
LVERHRVIVWHPPLAIEAGFRPRVTGEVDHLVMLWCIALE